MSTLVPFGERDIGETGEINIGGIDIGEKSPDNFGLGNNFSQITLLSNNGDTANISIDNSIFTVFWDHSKNQPKIFSIENNGENIIFISCPGTSEHQITLIGRNSRIYNAIYEGNPLMIIDNKVYIVSGKPSDFYNEFLFTATCMTGENGNTLIYVRRDGNSIKIRDTNSNSTKLLGNGYYTISDELYNIDSKEAITELTFQDGFITNIKYSGGNLFFGKYNDKLIHFCFSPLNNPQIPSINLLGETIYTDEKGFILEGNMKGYKIDNPEGYKIKEGFIVICLTDKKGNKNYLNINSLSNLGNNGKLQLLKFKKNDESEQKPFSCINDPESTYHGYPIIDERKFADERYSTGFSGVNGVDYAFVLTEKGDKKLVIIRGGKVLEINEDKRCENKTSHSQLLQNGKCIRIVGLHTNLGMVVLTTNNDSTSSNYRYYAIKKDGVLIYIGGKDNIDSGNRLFFIYENAEGNKITSKVILGRNRLPIVDFKGNKTFLVGEQDGKNYILCLKVVNDTRELTPEIIIEIPDGGDVEEYFQNFIDNKVKFIPGTDYLYAPGKSFYIEKINKKVNFIGLDGEVSNAEKMEDLPKVEIGGKSYYLLSNIHDSIPNYYLYSVDAEELIEIESLSSICIRTNSYTSISSNYLDKTGLKKISSGAYIYPKVNDLLPENIRLAIFDDNGVTKNQYVIYDKETDSITKVIPTSYPPIKTNNPNEFIISQENDDENDYNLKYFVYNIESGEIREKIIPEGLKLSSDTLTESYVIGFTGNEILMENGRLKTVKINGKDYYETKDVGELFNKKVIHLYDSDSKVLLPFFDENGALSPIFENVVGNMSSILIKDGELKYRATVGSGKISLSKIVSIGGKYIELSQSEFVNVGNNSLRIGKSLNDFFSSWENNYIAYLVESNTKGQKFTQLPQIEIISYSEREKYLKLRINGIELEIVDYDNEIFSANLQIIENYIKKILGSLARRYPLIVISEIRAGILGGLSS